EISSPVSGKVLSFAGEEGSIIHVGEVLLTIDETGKTSKNESPQKQSVETPQDTSNKKAMENQTVNKPPRRVRAAPVVRKLARELGVNIEEIVGTGPNGRVVEADVRRLHQGTTKDQSIINHTEKINTANSLGNVPPENKVEEIPFRGVRKKISENMVKSAYTIPHATGMG